MDQHNNGVNNIKLHPKDNRLPENCNNKEPYPVHFETGESINNWQPTGVTSADSSNFIVSEIETTSKIFVPTWYNRPIETPPVLTLNGLSILTHQNISAIIASQGIGKSSICEAIVASYLTPDADCLGFKVWDKCKGVIYTDFERTINDVWNSFYRLCRRAGIVEGHQPLNVKIAGMRSIPRLNERLTAVEFLLRNNNCSLLLLDGAGDLVTDTNDLSQAIDCRIFLRELTVKYDVSILTTLHPNPNSTKPRGHIGSEIMRESESLLLAKKYEGESRIITSDFEQGKNRNNAPVTTGYKWSDEKMMFISADIENISVNKGVSKALLKRKEAETVAKIFLPPPTTMTCTELEAAIMKSGKCSPSTADRRRKDMLSWDIITKRQDGLYMLTL